MKWIILKSQWTFTSPSLNSLLCRGWQESALNVFPVDDFPDLLNVVGSHVLVVNVVSVFPNVNGWISKKLLSKGVSPWGANISWLGVSMILNDLEMLSQANHPQPDPWIGTVFLVSSSCKFSYDPNCLTTAWVKAESSPGYSPPPLPMGARFSQ